MKINHEEVDRSEQAKLKTLAACEAMRMWLWNKYAVRHPSMGGAKEFRQGLAKIAGAVG